MPDVACFCGRYYRFEGDLGSCPRCGEYASLSTVSPEEQHQMRDELDLVLAAHDSRRDTHGPTPSLSKPRKWALVQVWNGAVLATFDDETSARNANSNADDDEVVVLQVRS